MTDKILEAIEGLSGSFDSKIENVQKVASERADALEAKFNEVQAESARAADELTQAQDSVTERALTLGMDAKDIAKYSVTNAIRGFIHTGNPEKDCPFELDVHKELMRTRTDNVEARMGGQGQREFQRTMTTLSDSTGGFLIPEEVSNTFYDNYRAQTVRGQLGVTEVSPMGIPFRLNKKTGNTTAYRRGESSSVAASDLSFGQLNLSPKSVSARTVISQENVMWSSPSVDALAERDLMETLNLKQDLDFLNGAGGSNTPIGVLNTTGVVNAASGSGTAYSPNYEAVGVDLPFLLENANALIDDGSLGYCGVPGHIKMLRKEQIGGSTTGDGAYVLAPWARPSGSEFLPYKWCSTTQLQGLGVDSGASPLLFGRWSDAIHATWGGLMVKRSDVATDGTNNALTEGWVHIVVTGWDDSGVIRPASIVYDNDMNHA